MTPPFPVVLRARHVRLQPSHVEALFGPKHALTPIADLPIVGSLACAEVVTVRGPGGHLDAVRVLSSVGALVRHTKVHLSPRDLGHIGLDASLATRSLAGSPGCSLEGPAGTVVLAEGVLVPRRTLLVSAEEARALSLVEGQGVLVELHGERAHRLADVRVVLSQVGEAVRALVLDLDDPLAGDIGPAAAAFLAISPAA